MSRQFHFPSFLYALESRCPDNFTFPPSCMLWSPGVQTISLFLLPACSGVQVSRQFHFSSFLYALESRCPDNFTFPPSCMLWSPGVQTISLFLLPVVPELQSTHEGRAEVLLEHTKKTYPQSIFSLQICECSDFA